jgi:GT2 family glycosyltransferase
VTVLKPLVTVVVVTHNRPKELQKVINALVNQTFAPDRILVLDNASDEEARTSLFEFPSVDVCRSNVNLGGAGGFALGIEMGLAAPCPDWVWLLDDDAVPMPDALEQLITKIPLIAQQSNQVGAICSAVYEFGKLATMHRRLFHPLFARECPIALSQYSENFVPVDTGSFVGFLLNTIAVQTVGLPNANYFLAYDDTEYSLRLKTAGFTNWLVPGSGIDHLRLSGSKLSKTPFGAKHYYNIRNRTIVSIEYAKWRMLALIKAGCIGLVIWLVSGGFKRPASFKILVRAISDGINGKLGLIQWT